MPRKRRRSRRRRGPLAADGPQSYRWRGGDMSNSWLVELHENGWAALDRAAAPLRLTELVAGLNATKIATRINRATSAGTARSNTLSSRYGLGEFPLHTDGADQDHPPRYVLLLSTVPRTAATLVLGLRRRASPLLAESNALFRVTGLRRCHYARFREYRPAGSMVRYNAATHAPVNEAAKEIEAVIAICAPLASRIDWSQTRAVVIDNWACLHGRERVDETDLGKMRRLHVWARK